MNGQPKYTKLLYDDSGNFPAATNFNNLLQMQYCKVDPRTGAGYTLSTSYVLARGVRCRPAHRTDFVRDLDQDHGPGSRRRRRGAPGLRLRARRLDQVTELAVLHSEELREAMHLAQLLASCLRCGQLDPRAARK